MRTLLAIAWMLLLGALVQPVYAQQAQEQPPVRRVVREDPPKPLPQAPERMIEQEEVKQVAPNKPEANRERPRVRQARGARPEIIRPGGRPAGAGRPKGARRPGRR